MGVYSGGGVFPVRLHVGFTNAVTLLDLGPNAKKKRHASQYSRDESSVLIAGPEEIRSGADEDDRDHLKNTFHGT